MGRSFFNVMVRGVTQEVVVKHLTAMDCRAFVSRDEDGIVAVFPRDWNEEMPADLSQSAVCTVLFVHINDGDRLFYRLYVKGRLVDSYDSYPGTIEAVSARRYGIPEGGDETILCAAFDVEDTATSVRGIPNVEIWTLHPSEGECYMRC